MTHDKQLPTASEELQLNLPKPTVIIESSQGLMNLQFRKLWQYRELLYFLVWRDLKVRYKQSILGVGWIIIQPLLTMIIFTIIFNRFLGVESEGAIPYPIFTYTALLPWTYFANSLSKTSSALIVDKNLISKVYFPRLIIPISTVLPGLVDFFVAFLIYIGMMFYYQIQPSWVIIFLPAILILAIFNVLGMGLWLSALNVQYRDIQYITPFLIQIWMYATPIIYSIRIIPIKWRWLYSINPMVGVVEIFRKVLLGDANDISINWISILITCFLVVSGLIYFKKTEQVFADVI